MKSARLTYNACVSEAKTYNLNDGEKLKEGHFNKKYVNCGVATCPKMKALEEYSNATTRQVAAQQAVDSFNNELPGSKTRWTKEKKQLRRLERDKFKLEKRDGDISEIQESIDNYVYKPEFKLRSCRDKHQNFGIPMETFKVNDENGKIVGITIDKKKFKDVPIEECRCKCNCPGKCKMSKNECKAAKGRLKTPCDCYAIGRIKTQRKTIPKSCDYVDSKITTINGLWYMILTYKHKPKNEIVLDKVAAIDPGIRTFLTSVDVDGKVTEYGNDCENRLKKAYRKKDYLHQKLDKRLKKCKEITEGKARFVARMEMLKVKRKLDLATNRISNKVLDMHHKVAKNLVDNYDCILIPRLRSDEILQEHCNDYNRTVMTLSHCKFHDLLKHKARIHDKMIVSVSEAHTTRTCLSCLRHNDVGRSKIHSCQCGYEAGRDVNAAYNILLKNIETC